jgi:Mg2+-importing ATPase
METPKSPPNSSRKNGSTLESEQNILEFQQVFAGPNFGKPLSWDEAEKRQALFGKNLIALQKKRAWYYVLLHALVHPFNLVLVSLAIVSLILVDFETATVMGVMVVLSTTLRFIQEWKSEVAAEALKDLVKNHTTVIRLGLPPESYKEKLKKLHLSNIVIDDKNPSTASITYPTHIDEKNSEDDLTPYEQEILLEDVVPGDIVKLAAGDLIPGDVFLLETKDLFVSQSILTGESVPVEKQASPKIHYYTSTSNNNNKTQTRSTASDVLPSSDSSEVELRELLEETTSQTSNHHPISETTLQTLSPSALIQQLDRSDICFFGTSVVSGTGTAVVLFIGRSTVFGQIAKQLGKRRPTNAFQKNIRKVSILFIKFMCVIALNVFLLSGFLIGDWLQSLLFAVSVAVGLTPEMLPMIVNSNLAKGAVVMARKKSIVKRLDSIINIGAMDVLCTDKTGTLTQDKVTVIKYLGIDNNEMPKVLETAFLVSHFQTGLKSLIDKAIVDYYERLPEEQQTVPYRQYTKLDEVPFDFQRRRMSVLLQRGTHRPILCCKGAVEETLKVCSKVKDSTGTVKSLDLETLQRAKELAETLNADGLRVVAVAYRKLAQKQTTLSIELENDLTFLGFVAFLDPPKESAGPAIRELLARGVTVKVLTGDSKLVCLNVCKQLGIEYGNAVITGPELEGLSENEIEEAAERNTIFAKLNPMQKAAVVRALKSRKHIVGFLGDGINDGAALKEADVGVSVDTAVDVAREQADIILLEKDLGVLVKGVIQGRITYGNTIKYIKMAASSNFGNVFSVLVASAWLPFLPMLPIHILVQNLLYDFSQIAIPWDRMDKAFVSRPQRWEINDLMWFMIVMGPISSLFDMSTFTFMWVYFGWQTPAQQTYFQTGWFLEGLLTQTLIVHMIRTAQIPFIQSVARWPMLLSTTLVVGIGIYLPFSFLSGFLQMEAPPPIYFAYLAGVIIGYSLLTQVAKFIYIRIFHKWL